MAGIEVHRTVAHQSRVLEIEGAFSALVLMREQLVDLEQALKVACQEREHQRAAADKLRGECTKLKDLVKELQTGRATQALVTGSCGARSAAERVIELVRCAPPGGDSENILYQQVNSVLTELVSTNSAAPVGSGLSAREIVLTAGIHDERCTLKEMVATLKQQCEAQQLLETQLRARCEGRERELRELTSRLAAAELAKELLLLQETALNQQNSADHYVERAQGIAFGDRQREEIKSQERALRAEIEAHKQYITSLHQELKVARDATKKENEKVVQLETTAASHANEITRLQAMLDEALEKEFRQSAEHAAALAFAGQADLELQVLRQLHLKSQKADDAFSSTARSNYSTSQNQEASNRMNPEQATERHNIGSAQSALTGVEQQLRRLAGLHASEVQKVLQRLTIAETKSPQRATDNDSGIHKADNEVAGGGAGACAPVGILQSHLNTGFDGVER